MFSGSFYAQTNTATYYFNNGVAKNFIKDYYGAIADFTKAIELEPNNAYAYKIRGLLKVGLKDYYGGCIDSKKAAELGDVEAARWVAEQCN